MQQKQEGKASSAYKETREGEEFLKFSETAKQSMKSTPMSY